VSKLKIDRSFINDVAARADDAADHDGHYRHGQSLGLKVVAEGVETQAQLAFLREQAATMRRLLLHRPVPAES